MYLVLPSLSGTKTERKPNRKRKAMQQNLDALLGTSDQGEYATGEQMTFLEDGVPFRGAVIHCAKAHISSTGKSIPRLYTVDCNDGFPHMVETRQIIEDRQ
jgi:hypothetical protein